MDKIASLALEMVKEDLETRGYAIYRRKKSTNHLEYIDVYAKPNSALLLASLCFEPEYCDIYISHTVARWYNIPQQYFAVYYHDPDFLEIIEDRIAWKGSHASRTDKIKWLAQSLAEK